MSDKFGPECVRDFQFVGSTKFSPPSFMHISLTPFLLYPTKFLTTRLEDGGVVLLESYTAFRMFVFSWPCGQNTKKRLFAT